MHREPGVLKFEGTLTAKKADTELTIKVSDKFSKTVKFNDAGVQTFELTLPSGLFIADPAEANYLSLQSNNPIMFKSFKLSHAG